MENYFWYKIYIGLIYFCLGAILGYHHVSFFISFSFMLSLAILIKWSLKIDIKTFNKGK
jgi:uncharacterized membrane protein YoaK (UPF0700 family)